MTEHEAIFDIFWKAYPKRNGKKVGKYPCSLWFEAKKPSEEEVAQMISWLTTDNGNRLASQKKFYAELPDPIRFLKNRMWEDDIDSIVVKPVMKRRCTKCGQPAVKGYGSSWSCSLDGICKNTCRDVGGGRRAISPPAHTNM